jgi:site-specific DNA-methyltransferase (adenine-specific)
MVNLVKGIPFRVLDDKEDMVVAGNVFFLCEDPELVLPDEVVDGGKSRFIDPLEDIPEEEYGEFTRRWITEAERVLAPTGSMYIFSGWNRLRDILEGIDAAELTTINHLIWKYQFGVFTKKKYVTSHYHILFVVKDPKRYTFNKIDHYPEDVWVINREYWKGRKKTPTKLPSELVKKILCYSSNPGDIVLDPFLGSGTVAVVARQEGRHFLGFEVVPEYYAFARESLSRRTGRS